MEFVQGLPPSQRFTTRQVAQLLKKVPHSNVRVRCLDLLAPRITDPQNYQEILRVLTFRAEKDHTRKLLSGD